MYVVQTTTTVIECCILMTTDPGDPDAWEKLQRALRAQIDPEAFERMRSTTSFPFQPGEHRRIAVKVIDFRGNEVVRVAKVGG
ncbi:MAG: hypothetical protein NZ578_11560 [Candidatus Binatia bacterium]|nr:hypothetical protein [Candidatus Binatia bacterium]